MVYCKWFEGARIKGDSFPVGALEVLK
jgi:uncharacterized protein YodC (DUF2158 family)